MCRRGWHPAVLKGTDAADGRELRWPATGIGTGPGTRPSFILQELSIQDIDGLDLVRELRRLPVAADVPIIAFSGMLPAIQLARVTQAGFTDYITKPVQPVRLVEIVSAYAPLSQGVDTAESRRVLVLDDDPIQRNLLPIILHPHAFHVQPFPPPHHPLPTPQP